MNPLTASAVAVSEATADEIPFLGRLATYTLPNDPRPGSQLVRAWAKHGLDVADLPTQRTPVDVFRSACRSVADLNRANGKLVEIAVDEVLNATDRCVYQVTRKVRDRAEQVIEHTKSLRIRFDKATSTIHFDALDGYDAGMVALESRIRDHFDANAKTVPGEKIRNYIRDQILRLGAQNLRRKSGGLYFVPPTYRITVNGTEEERETKPVLDGLAGVLHELYGDRADFYGIPLADDDDQRAMVRKHFNLNASQSSGELLQKVLNRVREGKGERGVRSDLVTNAWNEYRAMMGGIEQFDELVGLERQAIDANMRDLQDALMKLQELADGEDES